MDGKGWEDTGEIGQVTDSEGGVQGGKWNGTRGKGNLKLTL